MNSFELKKSICRQLFISMVVHPRFKKSETHEIRDQEQMTLGKIDSLMQGESNTESEEFFKLAAIQCKADFSPINSNISIAILIT